MKKTLLICSFFLIFSSVLLFEFKYYKKNIYRPHLTVMGYIKMADGLGRQCVDIIDALKDDISIRYKPTRGKDNEEDIPKAVLSIIHKKSYRMGKVILYEDAFHRNSHTFFEKYLKKENPDTIRIAYSMFESSAIPDYWVYNLNTYFDAVAVPDIFLIDCYKNSGVKIPIFVLPLGLNLKPFLADPLKQQASTPLVFANFSAYTLRKNHKLLIESFYEAFGDDPSVKLWINGRFYSDGLVEELTALIKTLNVSNILLTNTCFNNADYLQNFHKIDCYVSVSQGEGFSIQPREAMALGIPVIVSDNTGQSTICRSNLIKFIPSPILIPAYYEHLHEVFGFRYDVIKRDAVLALREMKASYQDQLKLSSEMRSWASQYEYSELRPLYKSLIKPKKVILGDENIIDKDCLMTNSEILYKKYKNIL